MNLRRLWPGAVVAVILAVVGYYAWHTKAVKERIHN